MFRTCEMKSESKGSPPMSELVTKVLGSLRSPVVFSFACLNVALAFPLYWLS